MNVIVENKQIGAVLFDSSLCLFLAYGMNKHGFLAPLPFSSRAWGTFEAARLAVLSFAK